MNLVSNMYSEFTLLKLLPHLPGANELMILCAVMDGAGSGFVALRANDAEKTPMGFHRNVSQCKFKFEFFIV